MKAAAEQCMAAARSYLIAADRFERSGQVALANTLGSVAADYIEAAQIIDAASPALSARTEQSFIAAVACATHSAVAGALA